VRQLLITGTAIFLIVTLADAQGGGAAAQGRGGNAPGGDVTTGQPSSNGKTNEGGVVFINPGTPVITDAEANSKPVPRLPDGHVDLTGPWVGGGAVADNELDLGGKRGEEPGLAWE
jgi:hypothetical protein